MSAVWSALLGPWASEVSLLHICWLLLWDPDPLILTVTTSWGKDDERARKDARKGGLKSALKSTDNHTSMEEEPLSHFREPANAFFLLMQDLMRCLILVFKAARVYCSAMEPGWIHRFKFFFGDMKLSKPTWGICQIGSGSGNPKLPWRQSEARGCFCHWQSGGTPLVDSRF